VVPPTAQSSTAPGLAATAGSGDHTPGIAPPAKWVKVKFEMDPREHFKVLALKTGTRSKAELYRKVMSAGIRALGG